MKLEDFDWRTYAVSELLQPLPYRGPGMPSHPAGTPLYVTITTRTLENGVMTFAAPSVVSMSINVARRAADEAKALRDALVISGAIASYRGETGPMNDQLPSLFDYFEWCMVAATFSFQAVEAFANDHIHRALGDDTFAVKGRGGEMLEKTALELERTESTQFKIGDVLPTLLGIGKPKGGQAWRDFKKLQTLRVATIHPKANDQAPKHKNGIAPDTESVFYRFLHDDVSSWPKSAMAVIAYFKDAGDKVPRYIWYDRLLREYGYLD